MVKELFRTQQVVSGSQRAQYVVRSRRAQQVVSGWPRTQLVVHEWVVKGSAGGECVV